MLPRPPPSLRAGKQSDAGHARRPHAASWSDAARSRGGGVARSDPAGDPGPATEPDSGAGARVASAARPDPVGPAHQRRSPREVVTPVPLAVWDDGPTAPGDSPTVRVCPVRQDASPCGALPAGGCRRTRWEAQGSEVAPPLKKVRVA